MINKNIGYIICEAATAKVNKIDIIGDNSGRRLLAEGELQEAEEKNRNGRIYPKKELFPQIGCPRTLELLKAGYMRAESGHPMSKDLARQQTIDPSNTCALFTKLWTSGLSVMGQFKGTNNALGEAFDLDLRDGYLPAWSLRALGSLQETRRGPEVVNLKLITYDHVIYPSHPGAYTTGIVSESGILLPSSSYNTPNHLLQEMDVANEVPENIKAESSIITPFNTESVISFIKQESANFHMIKESFDVLYDSISLIEGGRSVQLVEKEAGDTIIVNLEHYVHNQIMDYCYK